MRRGAVALLVVAVVAAAFCAVRGGGRGARSALPSHAPDESAPFPAEPRAFLDWLREADPEARRKAAAGPIPDDLLRAVIEALDGDAEWPYEFLRALGERAVPALEERCLEGGEGASHACSLAIRLAEPDVRQRILVACLGHAEEGIRFSAAYYLDEASREDPGLEVGAPLLHAMAAAFAAVENPEPHSDASDLRDLLSLALSRSLDGSGDDLRALLASDAPAVRAVAATLALGWTERYDEEGNQIPEYSRAAVAMLLPFVLDPDPAVRKSAVRALGFLDEVPVPREPLLGRLDDVREAPEVRAAAARALGRLAADADLRRHLHDQSPIVRGAVLDAFGAVEGDPSLAAEFVALLDDPDASVRESAAGALRPFAADPACRARLAKGLDDPDEQVRLACLQTLFGSPPIEAIPHLGRWIEEGSAKERWAALHAVRGWREKAAPLEMAIVAAASTAGRDDRDDLVEALAHLPGQDERVLAALALWARDDEVFVRREALKVLIRRFPERPATLDALDRALGDDAKVATVAAARLAELRRDLPAVVRACVSILSDKEALSFSGSDAIETLGRCGPSARDAVPALFRVMDQDQPYGNERALVAAFAALPELADATVPGLVERAAAGNRVALAALEALGPSAEPHRSAALKSLDPARRESFEQALEAYRHPQENR